MFQKTMKLLETFKEMAGNFGNVSGNGWKRDGNVSNFWIRLGNVSVAFPSRIPFVYVSEMGNEVSGNLALIARVMLFSPFL